MKELKNKLQINLYHSISWLSLIFVALVAVIILFCSLFIGNDPSYPKRRGIFDFVNMTKDMDGLNEYTSNIMNIIEEANETINMISHCFSFHSNYTHLFDDNPPEIIDTSEPNSFLHKEGEILQALKVALDQRHVKVRIITQKNFTNTSISFFKYKGVSYRTYDTNTHAFILNEIITADSKKILISSSLFDHEVFHTSRVVSVRFHTGAIIADDVDRFFSVTWKQLDEKEKNDIPPASRFWKYNVKARTSISNPYKFANDATAYLVQSKQVSNILPPERDDAIEAIQSLVSSAEKRIIISASFFQIEPILFLHEYLLQAGRKGIPVQILISDIPRLYRINSTQEELHLAKKYMLQQAATIAPLNNITVHVSETGTGTPDFLVVDDNLFFSSGPITAVLYGGSLGVALVVNHKKLADNFVQVFEEDWSKSTPFENHLTQIYKDKIY